MLVALHGFTETDLSWQEVFGSTGLDLATPLLPGHGWRPCPSGTTVPSCAADLAAGIDQPCDLLGYSMGGRIALQLALDHPDKVRRLILISTRPGIRRDDWRTQRIARDEGLAEILEEDGLGTFVAWWENHPVLRPYRPLSGSAEERLRSHRLNQEAKGLAAALRCLGQGRMESLWDRLGEIAMPVLLLAGSADRDFCADMTAMAEVMPTSRLDVIDECGHAIHRECPDRLRAAVIRFLTDQGTAA